MINRHIVAGLLLVTASITVSSAPITFSFPVSLQRAGCVELEICRFYGGSDAGTFTLELELANPFLSQTIGPSAVTRASYGAPFPYLGEVSVVARLEGAYSYDAPTAVATLTLSDYWILATLSIGDMPHASLNAGAWEYDGSPGYYKGFPHQLAPAAAFVGAPIPISGVFPLFALALTGLARRRRRISS